MDVISTKQLELLAQIDFEKGCEFIDGQCRRMRLVKPRLLCCNSCGSNVGYLQVSERELPKEYKALFTHNKGFLGEHGCKLPTEKRSVICSSYACPKCNVTDEERELIEKIIPLTD